MTDKSRAEYHLGAYNIQAKTHIGYAGITLLYVRQGQLTVRSTERCLTLHPDDVLLINKNHAYTLNSTDDNVVICLEVSNHYFSRYYNRYFQHQFLVSSEPHPTPKSKHINMLKVLLAKMLMTHTHGHNDFSLLEANQCLSEILLMLVLYFKEDNPSAQRRNSSFSKRINKVISTIETHYHENISLTQVAQTEHVSLSYLSRLFKKEVGLSFMQYLMNIKFEHAVIDLINTSKPLYQITQDHGFSSTKQFIQRFKSTYQQTPNQFRQQHKNNAHPFEALIPKYLPDLPSHPQHVDEVDTMHLLALLNDTLHPYITQSPLNEHYYPVEAQTITLTTDKKTTPIPKLDYIIHIGELSEVLKQTIQQQLLQIQREAKVDYVGIHHLISGNTILPEYPTDEPIPSFSPYIHSDHAIAFLKQNHMALFITLTHQNMATDLAAHGQKLAQFLTHNVNVFGIDYLQSWQFMYTAPNHRMAQSPEFEQHFHTLKNTIQSVLPHAKIGLFLHPSDVIPLKKDPFFKSSLAQSADFLGYSANPNEQVNLAKISHQSLADSEHHISEKTKNIRYCLKYNNLNTPLFLITWNTLTGDTRHTNGRFFRGALILNTLINVSGKINGIGFWINTEHQEEALTERIDTTSLALFYVFNTKRPAFYALAFRNRLQGCVVAMGQDYLVTETHQGYQIVLTNTAAFNPYISIKEHLMKHFRKEKTILFQGIKPGSYQIRQFIFDQQHGALYRQFEQFQTQYGRDEEIMAYLQQSMPSLTVHDEYIKHSWTIMSELDINAVHFYELRRMT